VIGTCSAGVIGPTCGTAGDVSEKPEATARGGLGRNRLEGGGHVQGLVGALVILGMNPGVDGALGGR
jgi:hypothetical protein